MSGQLAGQVALVTGAGRGIGAAMAGWLADEGADLVLLARSATELEQVATDARARGGVSVLVCPGDVTRPEDVAVAVEAASSEFGRVDIAVANAAVLGPVGPVTAVDPRWTDTLA